ncbi:ferredoxin [Candidatus Woesearchaeota archaeon]|nr:ferredoxin [Candidatus Woesearchaeota archaeon]
MAEKYKVQLDRPGCIGAAACAAANSKRWVMSPQDGKVDLTEGKPMKQEGWLETEIDEAELATNIEAAKACPVAVIHILKKTTGEKIA